MYIDMAEEGFNLAFIYNTSSTSDDQDCDQGLSCSARDLGNILVAGYDEALKDDMLLFENSESLEEFEFMRPSIKSRQIDTARDIKEYMETRGQCDQCTRWMMSSVETKSRKKVGKLDVGSWSPTGTFLKDDLFPHVKGNFRGRTIPIASVHVGNEIF